MENYNQNPAPDQDKGLDQLDDSKLRHDLPQENKAMSLVKNVLIFILLVAVIIGSFWISFQLGKKILVPVKRKPVQKIEITVPEPPASIKGLQSLDELPAGSGDAGSKVFIEEDVVQPKPVPRKITKPKVIRPQTYTKPSSSTGQYYKVQAGLFSAKSSASDLAKKISSNGFSTFVKKINSQWRVQVGAYRVKKYALNLQRSLKAKGFDSVLVYE